MIVPDYDREGIQISFTYELGVYEVFSNGELFTAFPTRLHPFETLKPRMNQTDFEYIIPNKQTRWLALENGFSQTFSETRQGKSLWKIFLAIAMVLLIAETILGRPNPVKMKGSES